MRIIDCEQGTAQWLEARCGKATASKIADIIAKTKTGPSAMRANYMAQLVVERLTGTMAETYSNDAMKWGTETEPLARKAYEFENSVDVRQVGFVCHPSIEMAGASPDGLIGDDGLLEIKCPNSAQHIATLLGEPVTSKYVTQMEWQMICCGRTWCDFVSFDPRLPAHLRTFTKRFHLTPSRAEELNGAVIEFLSEVSAKVEALNKLEAA